MQWWCSPQSSVPRQTVGHHARAATDELERCEPAKAAARGRPASAGRPPRRAFFHIPTDRRAGRGTPAGVPAPAVGSRKTRSVWASLKIDSRPRETHLENPAPGALEEPGGATEPNQPPSPSPFPFPLFFPSLSSLPPRIPTDGRAGRGTPAGGSRAGGRIPQNPICMRLAKNRLTGAARAPDPRGGETPDAAPRGNAPAGHPAPTRAQTAALGPHQAPTLHLPCTHPHFCSLSRPLFSSPRQAPAVNGDWQCRITAPSGFWKRKVQAQPKKFMQCSRVGCCPNQVQRSARTNAINQTLPPPSAHPAPTARADAGRRTGRAEMRGCAPRTTRSTCRRPCTPEVTLHPADRAALGSAPPTYPAPTLHPPCSRQNEKKRRRK